jgi:hypothetical protein
MSKTPISFRVPETLWERFTAQTSALFLSYGPFLDHMLTVELPHLQKDLQGKRLSLRAKRYVSGELKRVVPEKPNVNFSVRRETAELLRHITSEHNIVRDAFFCRLLVLLRSTDAVLKYLDVPRHATDRGLSAGLEEMPSSPLGAMEAVRDDPLFYIREHIQDAQGLGLYLVGLPASYLHCYVEDEFVPGTGANRRFQRLLAQL